MRLQEQHQAMLLEQSLLAVLKPLVGEALLIEKEGEGASAVHLGGEANRLEWQGRQWVYSVDHGVIVVEQVGE